MYEIDLSPMMCVHPSFLRKSGPSPYVSLEGDSVGQWGLKTIGCSFHCTFVRYGPLVYSCFPCEFSVKVPGID